MINLFLERNHKTIVLDKVLVDYNTQNQHLAFNSDAIKFHTAKHFQTIAGFTNRIVTDLHTNAFSPNWPI